MRLLFFLASAWPMCAVGFGVTVEQHLLYVATPGIRDDPHSGGEGIAVFDIDHDFKFLHRIPVPALGDDANPRAAKGICASAITGRLYVSTPRDLSCIDLQTEKVIWLKTFDNGCDRMSMSPDGKTIYEPTLEGAYWHVIRSDDGREIARVNTGSGSHNTVFARDGRRVFLAGLHSPLLSVADSSTNMVLGTVGPFSNAIRPFTVNGASTRCYVCVNDLLGFEIGDIASGKKLCRVEVQGFAKGPTARHGCPSHGIGLTPDEKQVWVADAHNRRMHIFDNTTMPPRQVASVELRGEPGWITFTLDGRYAFPSTGDVIDVQTRKVVAGLRDEVGREVASEKLLEIEFNEGKIVAAGDQFGVGRAENK